MTTPRYAPNLRFPQPDTHRLFLTVEEHEFLAGAIGPCHGRALEDFLTNAATVAAGRCITGTDDEFIALSNAVDIEIIAYRKIESDDGAKPRRKPKPGGTVARLMAISDKLTPYHS